MSRASNHITSRTPLSSRAARRPVSPDAGVALRKRYSISALVCLGMLAGASSGCTERAEAKARLPETTQSFATPIRVTRPQKTVDSASTELVGSIRSRQEVTLSASSSGQVVKLAVEVGDKVKKGQLLVRLDASQAATALSGARAAQRLANATESHAQVEMERTTALFERGALADVALDGAKTQHEVSAAQVEQAQAAVRSSQQRIADSMLRAPFDGVVSARHISQGEMATVMPPTRLITIVDPNALQVRLSVPESLLPYVKVGDTLKGTVSPSGDAVQVEVSARSTMVNERTRTVEVLADIVSQEIDQLLVGMLVTLDAATSPSIRGPFIPTAAVRKDDQGQYVLVVKDDQLQKTRVKGQPLNPGIMSVPEGLDLDALVALDPSQSLKAGTLVRVLED